MYDNTFQGGKIRRKKKSAVVNMLVFREFHCNSILRCSSTSTFIMKIGLFALACKLTVVSDFGEPCVDGLSCRLPAPKCMFQACDEHPLSHLVHGHAFGKFSQAPWRENGSGQFPLPHTPFLFWRRAGGTFFEQHEKHFF